MTYYEKDYFAVVRSREGLFKSPFWLIAVRGSSKDALEKQLKEVGLVPFQNRLMTLRELVNRDREFYEKVGIVDANFEAEIALAIRNFNAEHNYENFNRVSELVVRGERRGYTVQDEIYRRACNLVARFGELYWED